MEYNQDGRMRAIIAIIAVIVVPPFLTVALFQPHDGFRDTDRSGSGFGGDRLSGSSWQPSLTAEEALEDRFAKVLPDFRAAVSTWFKQEGLRVLPQTVGGDAGDLKKIGPIIVTRVTGTRTVTWPSHRFANRNSGVSLSHLTANDSDLVKKGTVRFEQGAIRIDAANFPADGKWHLFCLATEEPLGTSEEEREVFCVQRSDEKEVQGNAASPVEMLVRGYIAEAWANALDGGWNENQLRCFVFMASGQTELLAREAHASQANSLSDKRYAFLLRDLDASVPRLDALKQSLLQRLLIAP